VLGPERVVRMINAGIRGGNHQAWMTRHGPALQVHRRRTTPTSTSPALHCIDGPRRLVPAEKKGAGRVSSISSRYLRKNSCKGQLPTTSFHLRTPPYAAPLQYLDAPRNIACRRCKGPRRWFCHKPAPSHIWATGQQRGGHCFRPRPQQKGRRVNEEENPARPAQFLLIIRGRSV